MCAGKTGSFVPLLFSLSVLSEPWLALTSMGAGLQRHLANKHKYSVPGHHVLL